MYSSIDPIELGTSISVYKQFDLMDNVVYSTTAGKIFNDIVHS